MRKINYEVATATGKTFTTADYTKAIIPGNKVVRTFFTKVPDPAEEKAVEALVKFHRKYGI